MRRDHLTPILLFFSVAGLAQAPAAATDKARTTLTEGFNSGDATVRVEAIRAAGLIGSNEILHRRLEQNLEDGNVDVRIATIKTLADLKSTESIPALRKRLNEDKTPEVAFTAAKALYAMHDQAGQDWLLDVYNGKRDATSSAFQNQMRKFFGNFPLL